MKFRVFVLAALLIITGKMTLAGDITLATTEKTYAGYTMSALVDMDERSLANLLPEDADVQDMTKQKRAIRRGLYWAKGNKVKPLDEVF